MVLNQKYQSIKRKMDKALYLIDDPSFIAPEQTEEQSTETVSYTVISKKNKKRNDSFSDEIEIEEIHHHPTNTNTQCDCCLSEMTAVGSSVAREEAKFIPATMKRVQHIEHAYEYKTCKKDATQKAQIKRGKAPQAAIQRSIAGPTVLQSLSSTYLFTVR